MPEPQSGVLTASPIPPSHVYKYYHKSLKDARKK
jgi:hypothetical protein